VLFEYINIGLGIKVSTRVSQTSPLALPWVPRSGSLGDTSRVLH